MCIDRWEAFAARGDENQALTELSKVVFSEEKEGKHIIHARRKKKNGWTNKQNNNKNEHIAASQKNKGNTSGSPGTTVREGSAAETAEGERAKGLELPSA